MKVIISPIEFDTVCLSIDAIPEDETVTRRGSRQQTLTPGAVAVDGGYTDADRTWGYTADARHFDNLLWMLRYHSQIRLSERRGVWRGRLESVTESDGRVRIVFLPIEDLTESVGRDLEAASSGMEIVYTVELTTATATVA